MEIKVVPVTTSMRFPVHSALPGVSKPHNGVPWVFVALLCGGCILVTVLIYETRKQNQISEKE